jgi:four helix bundle protein
MINNLDDFKVYNLAMKLGDDVWNIVTTWNYFEKDVMGKQLIKAVDSIAANLSEGLGRYHFKETKNFTYFSRGSLYEAKTWLIKANSRRLIPDENLRTFMGDLDTLGKMLNSYINSLENLSRNAKP